MERSKGRIRDEKHNTSGGRVDKEGQTTNNSRQRILRISVKGLDRYQQQCRHCRPGFDDGAASVLRVTVANV